ncbi:MAG: pseudouridine synthase [Bacilli bacterium]
MEEKMRLQKAMAQKGICSRRKAEELISEGKVKVNGTIIQEQGVQVTLSDKIEVIGWEVESQLNDDKFVTYLLNKPNGVISSAKDDRGRTTVCDLLKKENKRLYPVGRLDYNTSGALLMTNDGELSNLVTHPSSHLDKTYIATFPYKVDILLLEKFTKGILLDDGMTEPAQYQVLLNTNSKSIVKITIHEGRNRQVRRMFEALGYKVKSLHRESIGFLDVKNIERGTYIQLSDEQVERIKNICKANKEKNVIPLYKRNK